MVSWDPTSAPNAAYGDVLGILNTCPPHDEGVLFAYLSDIQPDPYYSLRLNYGGREASRCAYVVTLIASENISTTQVVGDGYRVTTSNIKDLANPNDLTCYTVVGYCSLDNLPGFRLDPPRGKTQRCALCMFTKMDKEGFHVHKLEYLEPDQITHAIACFQKLRNLSMRIHPESEEKRSHNVACAEKFGPSPEAKKARTLRTVPTDGSLEVESAA